MKFVWTIAVPLMLAACSSPDGVVYKERRAGDVQPDSVSTNQIAVYKAVADDLRQCDVDDGRVLVPGLYGRYWINIDARLKKSLDDSVSCEMPTALPGIQQYNGGGPIWTSWKVPKD